MEKGLSGRVLGEGKYVMIGKEEVGERSRRRSGPGRYMTVEDGMQEVLRRRHTSYVGVEDEGWRTII